MTDPSALRSQIEPHVDPTVEWERREEERNYVESGYSRPGSKQWRFAEPMGELGKAIFGPSIRDFSVAFRDENPNPWFGDHGFSKEIMRDRPYGGRRLRARQFIDLQSAAAYANAQGRILSSHISITWGLLGIDDHNEASKALDETVLHHFKGWYQGRFGRPAAWVYVHEVGAKHGFHTHLLVDFSHSQVCELKRYLAKRLRDISKVGELPPGTFHVSSRGDRQIEYQWRTIQYISKGIARHEEIMSNVGKLPTIPVGWLIRQKIENPGDVLCKKNMGMAQCLGRTSRKRAGFTSLLEQGVVDVRRIYAGLEYLDYLRRSGDDCPPVTRQLLLDAEARCQEIEEEERVNQEYFAHCRANATGHRSQIERLGSSASVEAVHLRIREEVAKVLSALDFENLWSGRPYREE